MGALIIFIQIRFHRGDDDAASGSHRGRDVAPPVHRHDFFCGIVNSAAREQKTRVFRKEKINLKRCLAVTAAVVDTQDGTGFRVVEFCCETRGTGVGVVSAPSAVEFDAARKPCVADGEIAGTEFGVGGQQFASGGLVEQTPEASAERENEFGAEKIIFENC